MLIKAKNLAIEVLTKSNKMRRAEECIVCPICRENLANGPPNETNNEVIATQCGHMGHRKCLTSWFIEKEQRWRSLSSAERRRFNTIEAPCPKCMQDHAGKTMLKIYPDTDAALDIVTTEERRKMNETIKEKIELQKQINEQNLKMKKDEKVITQLTQHNDNLIEKYVKEKKLRDELEMEKRKLLEALKISETLNDKLKRKIESGGLKKEKQIRLTETNIVAEEIEYLRIEIDDETFGEIFRYRDQYIIGDGIAYQTLRSAFQEEKNISEKIRTSKFHGSNIPTRAIYENILKLPTTPTKVILSLADMETSRGNESYDKVKYYITAILTALYVKGTRNITILPCITYENMPENRKKLNYELKNDIGPRNYWNSYEYVTEIEEHMRKDTQRIKRNDSEGRSRQLLTNEQSAQILKILKEHVRKTEDKQKCTDRKVTFNTKMLKRKY